MYASRAQIEKIMANKDQNKVKDKVSQIYENLKENELYQKR